jgi:hypothetical protein
MPGVIMPPTDRLTILFLAANPRDTDQLKLDEEVRAIDESLRKAQHRDLFDLRSHWALRYGDLQELLLRYNPHIVHFSGHGSPSGEIALSDNSGQTHLIDPDALARLFGILRDNIRCVVLNACYSEKQARGIAKSIDCVVGMKRAVKDDAAIQFAAAFYLALGYGRSVATAFELGRNSMGVFVDDEEKTPKLLAPRVDAATIVLAGAPAPASPPAAAVAAGGVVVVPPLRELKGKQLLGAMNAMLSAYTTEAALAEMVQFHFGENLAVIVGGSGVREKVFNLLEWARMRGRLSELLQAAIDGRPDNLELRDFIASLQ